MKKRNGQKKAKQQKPDKRYQIEITARRGLLVVDIRQVFLTEKNTMRFRALLSTLIGQYSVPKGTEPLWSQRPSQAYEAGGGWWWFICQPQHLHDFLTPIQIFLHQHAL